ncbi:MAG: 23S rRNA (pseudouridine(1915)-N(3))-methyltransferase RlmH, partial [Pseudomonadota bacterium]|nr:23S rRNA (pseudouridine(1915)-N(3))-methyltransferase RlmH [Pseudomonadota bacterium]
RVVVWACAATDARVSEWRERGIADRAFDFGGADGLDPTVRAAADLVLAFGRQTWPHMMARAMLIEQIYRAQQIILGHPYHRA